MSGLEIGTIEILPEDLPLQRFYRWERERADRPFLTQPFGGGKLREWTFVEAAGEIRRIAAYLKAQGWPAGTNVAILSKNYAWWVMADLAIWMAGYVVVPVYPTLRAQSVRQILEHSGARACFVGPTEEKEAPEAGIPAGVTTVRFPNAGPDWDRIVQETPPLEGNPVRPADELATIFYTSGTTGIPKGVMHRFGMFTYQLKVFQRILDLTGEEHRVLSYLPLAHILERGGQEIPAVLLGWHVYFTEGPETFLTDLKRARPTSFFLSVPRLLLKFQQGVREKVPARKLDRLLRIPVLGRLVGKKVLRELGLDRVRYAACGSAPLEPELLWWYRRLGLNLVEGYGLTEGMITHLTRQGNVRPGYVGPALDGVEARRSPQGELQIKSPLNMLGYYKDPQATREAFTEDGFLRTGDLVDIEPDGQTRIIGRLKEQFKTSKGNYVVPAPIETKLLAHPDIESACLMGSGLASPAARVVLSPEGRRRASDPVERAKLEASFAELLARVNSELNPHERVAFLAVAEGPWTIGNGMMTPTLKLRRGPLERLYLARIEEWKQQGRPVIWETTQGHIQAA